MSEKPHSAIDRYKARREGKVVPNLTADERLEIRSPRQKIGSGKKFTPYRRSQKRARRLLMWASFTLVTLILLAWQSLPGHQYPIQLVYEIDLLQAPNGSLTVTMITEGKLPGKLDLEVATGRAGNPGNGVEIHSITAFEMSDGGMQGKSLAITDLKDGWQISTQGTRRAVIAYRIDLSSPPESEEDIRQYISTPVEGGIRAAGFEIFLLPTTVPVGDITVMIHNPRDLPVLVPWPALVRGVDRLDSDRDQRSDPLDPSVQPAHLGLGQGFQPAAKVDFPSGKIPSPGKGIAAPVPASLFFHPRDLADLNNALIICGDIRTSTVQTRDCVIQLATDQDWLFSDEAALDLIRRIARTELGFFGSAPNQQITVILSANRVTVETGFDVYGVHTGSSILVLMDPETTYGMLEKQVSSVIAHEMFHGWLGEAIRQTDPQTLWFTEGITTWYSARMLVAAGLWAPDHGRETLLSRLERDYVGNDLMGTISLAEAAAEVMAGPDQVRFAYAAGVAAAMSLDQWLATNSGLQRPLDEVLRHLYENYLGRELSREIIEEAIHTVTGVDCHDWLEAHVYGKTALPPLEQLI
ncbi:MAG: hypothetical protein KOO60_10165 [Gemmatimonadales bacterium]|nr:hypothetical protein [Gemmatimonadales bacterium]